MKIINAKGCNDSLTPNKAKRRPGGGNPSPSKATRTKGAHFAEALGKLRK